MNLFGNRKPQPQPDPGPPPFEINEFVVPSPAVLDPLMVDHQPGRIVSIEHTDNPRDPVGPWHITLVFPNGWHAMFAAAELTRYKGFLKQDGTRLDPNEPTPIYDQVKDEGFTASFSNNPGSRQAAENMTVVDDFEEYADELASIGDRIEDDLRALTRRNERRAAARKGMRS